MIIPIKCVTCGTVLADKYRFYQEQVLKKKLSRSIQVDKVIYLTNTHVDKTPEAEVLEQLKLRKICCKRHMLTHVDN